MIKRYDLKMDENKDGDWVKYEDYNNLHQRGCGIHLLIRELYDLVQPKKKDFVYTSEEMLEVCKNEFGKIDKKIIDLESEIDDQTTKIIYLEDKFQNLKKKFIT